MKQNPTVRVALTLAEYKALRQRAARDLRYLKDSARAAMVLGLAVRSYADDGCKVLMVASDGTQTELHVGL